MIEWEYMSWGIVGDDGDEASFNELGNAGWELVAVDRHSIAWFKRDAAIGVEKEAETRYEARTK